MIRYDMIKHIQKLTGIQLSLLHWHVAKTDKKLSCRRNAARNFVWLNILLSHSRSFKVVRNYNE